MKTKPKPKAKAKAKAKPKVRSERPVPLTLRENLDMIEEALMRKDEVARRLWRVLSSLRGPDTPIVGNMTDTLQVRRLAFPRIAHQADYEATHGVMGIAYSVGAMFSHVYVSSYATIDHFQSHINRAMEALKNDGPM